MDFELAFNSEPLDGEINLQRYELSVPKHEDGQRRQVIIRDNSSTLYSEDVLLSIFMYSCALNTFDS